MLRDQGRFRSAEETIRRAISAYKTKDGDDLYSLKAKWILGSILYCEGHYDRAEKLLIETLAYAKSILGLNHETTLTVMSALSTVYILQDRLDEAEDLTFEVLNRHIKTFGEEDPFKTSVYMHNVATVYAQQRRYTEAEEMLLKVIDVKRKTFGQDHISTLKSMACLACVYRDLKRRQEAETLFLRMSESLGRVLGEEHPDTILSMYDLAWAWKEMDRYEDAVELMVKCVQLRTRVLGPDHPFTLESKNSLTEWQAEGATASFLVAKETSSPVTDRFLWDSYLNI